MTEEDYTLLQNFNVEFKQLVRKYMPEYPETPERLDVLYAMQDRTSCFAPFIWSDENKSL